MKEMNRLLVKVNICFLLLLLVLVSGCAKKAPKADKNVGWQDEVLLAQECGIDNLKCCPDVDPPCNYGLQCCKDPNNSDSNFCSNDCSCGKEKKFCCATGQQCEDGLVCSNGRCAKCGNDKEPCCTDNKCAGELVCHNDQCLTCGIVGNPCCPNQPFCNEQDKTDEKRAECKNSTCQLCGTNGYDACAADPFCNKGNLLNNNVCYPCGKFNNPCCDKISEVGYDCDPAEGLVCKLGFCDKK